MAATSIVTRQEVVGDLSISRLVVYAACAGPPGSVSRKERARSFLVVSWRNRLAIVAWVWGRRAAVVSHGRVLWWWKRELGERGGASRSRCPPITASSRRPHVIAGYPGLGSGTPVRPLPVFDVTAGPTSSGRVQWRYCCSTRPCPTPDDILNYEPSSRPHNPSHCTQLCLSRALYQSRRELQPACYS